MDREVYVPGWADAELTLIAAEADTCALAGRVRSGQRLLTSGLEAAEQYMAAGESWSYHLRSRWRRALYEYLRRHRCTSGS